MEASFYEVLRVKMVLSRLDSILLNTFSPPPFFFWNKAQKETSNQAELQAEVNAILLWVQPPTLLKVTS